MSAEPHRIPDLKVKTVSVDDSTWTSIAANKSRRFLDIHHETGQVDIYVAYQDAQPASTAEATLYDVNFKGHLFDGAGVPISKVWIYQTSGGTINQKYLEY